MGDKLLETQAGNTKKRRQRVQRAERQPPLFNRSEELVHEYSVQVEENKGLPAGARLHCLPGNGSGKVDVLSENHLVGTIADEGGDQLLKSLKDVGCLPAEVAGVCPLTGDLKILVRGARK